MGDPAKFGVVTVSDRASSGVYQDLGGPAILGFFAEAIRSPWEAVYRVIPDDQEGIESTLIDLVCVCGGGGMGFRVRGAAAHTYHAL